MVDFSQHSIVFLTSLCISLQLIEISFLSSHLRDKTEIGQQPLHFSQDSLQQAHQQTVRPRNNAFSLHLFLSIHLVRRGLYISMSFSSSEDFSHTSPAHIGQPSLTSFLILFFFTYFQRWCFFFHFLFSSSVLCFFFFFFRFSSDVSSLLILRRLSLLRSFSMQEVSVLWECF